VNFPASDFNPWQMSLNEDAGMADTKPADNKNHSRRRLLFSLLVVAVMATLAVMTTPKSAVPEYRRYVGPPLQDGSRVTFLYPASFSEVEVTPANQWFVQIVQMARPTVMNRAEAIWYKLPLVNSTSLVRDVGVTVSVMNISDIYRGHQNVPSGRFQTHWTGWTPVYNLTYPVYVDEVDVFDARKTRQYAFEYSHIGNLKTVEFEVRKAKIVNSFQVLPPGAAVPTP
jgi:hypothetical protein